MASILDQLGIDQAEYNSIEAQKATGGGSSALTPGVYDVAVEKAFVRKADSGASMLELEFSTSDGEVFGISVCIKKKNGDVNAPGIADMKHFLDATGVADTSGKEGQVKWKDSNITALCMPQLTGSRMKLGIRNEDNGEYGMKNIVSAYMNKDGKNGAGESIVDEVSEKIEKNPIKVPKKKPATAAATTSGADASAVAASGW